MAGTDRPLRHRRCRDGKLPAVCPKAEATLPYAQADGIVYGGNTYLRPTQYSKAPPKIVSINQKLSNFVLLAENYTGEFWTTAPFTGKGGNPARIDYTRHSVGGKGVANILFADFHIEPLSYQQTLDRPVITVP